MGRVGEDHLFLSETRLRLTKNGIELLFVRLRKRAGLCSEPISPQSFRHGFALRYLQAGGDPGLLQTLLGHEGMETIKRYLHLHGQMLQDHKQKERAKDPCQDG